MHDGHPWPRISIVTPSYNQGHYIEETIRSILLQAYPNLEYVIMDGGSTDSSQEIIRKYEQWLTFWTSEPDRGQSAAINKGLRRITGDIFNWINSDDFLVAGSLQAIAEGYRLHPDSLLAGDVFYVHDDSAVQEKARQKNIEFRKLVEFWKNPTSYHQPGIFIPMHLVNKVGALDEDLHYVFDYEMFCRLLCVSEVLYLNQPVATYRVHSATKSVSKNHLFFPELCAASQRYWPRISDLDLPVSDPKGSGLLLRAGLWMVLHRHPKGAALIREALTIDPLMATISTLLYIPGWLWRRWSQWK